jgi:hypothetical protein
MIDQADVLAIRPGSEVELLIDVGGGGQGTSRAAGTVLQGTVREVAQRDWNPSDEGLAAGDEQDRRRTHDGSTTQYQVQIEIAAPVDGVVFDTLIPAKIHVEYESLGAKIMRRLAQTFRFE